MGRGPSLEQEGDEEGVVGQKRQGGVEGGGVGQGEKKALGRSR